MNIVHITHGKVNPAGTSGISRSVYYLDKHLKLAGHNSQILSVVDGIRKPTTYKRDLFVSMRLFPRVFVSDAILRYLASNITAFDVACFHMPWKIDKVLCSEILRKHDVPYIVTSHASYTEANIGYSFIKKLIAKHIYERNFLNDAKAIHAITREEIMSLRNFGVRVPIFVVPNGIEIGMLQSENLDYHYFRSNTDINSKTKIIWVGSFRPYKNIDSLILAASLLPRGLRDDLVFIMVGPTDISAKSTLPQLVRLAKRCNVSTMFHFVGPLHDTQKYSALLSADVYIHPSWSDVISFSVLDAMACAKPCLITRTSNISYFHKYDFFEMVEPYPDDIARGIVAILQRQKEWQKMGANARRLIETSFNWTRIVHDIITHYQE